MRQTTDYPKLIGTLKEEIQTLKNQLALETETSLNASSTTQELYKKDVLIKQCTIEAESLRSQLTSQRELTQSLFMRLSLLKRLSADSPNSAHSLSSLAARLKSQISDIEQRTKQLNGGSFQSDDANTSRADIVSAKKSANEQFTQLQKKATALETKNAALRERLKTLETDRQRLEDNYQNALTRAKCEGGVAGRRAALEQSIAETEREIAAVHIQLHRAKPSAESPDRAVVGLRTQVQESQGVVAALKESVKYWQGKVSESAQKRNPAAISRLKEESRELDEELQLTSRLIREKDRELLELELTCEQLKTDLEAGKSELERMLCGRSAQRTNSNSPINRSLATVNAQSDLATDRGKQKLQHLTGSPNSVKRSESLFTFQRAKPAETTAQRPLGLASRIVAMNRGQFELSQSNKK